MIQFQNSQVLSHDEIVTNCVINHGSKSLLERTTPGTSSSLTRATSAEAETTATLEKKFQNILASRRRRRDTDGGRDFESTQHHHHHQHSHHHHHKHPQQQQNIHVKTPTNNCSKFHLLNDSNTDVHENSNKNSPTIVCDKIITDTNAWLFGNDYVHRIDNSAAAENPSVDGTVSSTLADDVDTNDYHAKTRLCQNSSESTTNRHQRPPKSSPITIPSNLRSSSEIFSKFNQDNISNRIMTISPIIVPQSNDQEYSCSAKRSETVFADKRDKMCPLTLSDYLQREQHNLDDERRVSSTSMTWLDEDFNQEIADLMVKQNFDTPTRLGAADISTTTATTTAVNSTRKAVEAILRARNGFKHTQTFDDCDSAPGTPLLDVEDALSERWLLDEEYSRLEAAKSAFWSGEPDNSQPSTRNELTDGTPALSSFIVCHHRSAFLPISPA